MHGEQVFAPAVVSSQRPTELITGTGTVQRTGPTDISRPAQFDRARSAPAPTAARAGWHSAIATYTWTAGGLTDRMTPVYMHDARRQSASRRKKTGNFGLRGPV